MNNYRVAILAVIILIILFAGAFFIYQKQVGNNTPAPEKTPSPETLTLPSPTPNIQPASGPQASQQPESGSNTLEVKNIGIRVDTPTAASIISSPIAVTGSANVFEGKIVISIKDANGNLLGTGQATACMGYDACPFTTTIDFAKSSTEAGIIEVYNPSGIDGSAKYLQSILVRF